MTEDMRMVIPNPAGSAIFSNKALITFAKSTVWLPPAKSLHPDAGALRWHRQNIARL